MKILKLLSNARIGAKNIVEVVTCKYRKKPFIFAMNQFFVLIESEAAN